MKTVLRFIITAFAGVMTLAGAQSFAADSSGGTMANFSGHVRTRYEIVDNANATKSKWTEQFLNRARINMDLMPMDSLKVRIAPEAMWQWNNPTGNVADVVLHEGWMSWMPSDSVSLWVGRQTITYGKERIFTDLDWGQAAVTHDSARVRFSYDMGQSDLFWVKAAENHFNTPRRPDTDLLALYNSFNMSEQTGFINTLDLYGLVLWNGSTGTKTQYFTIGALVDGGMDAFDYNVEAAAQFGKFAGAKSQKGLLMAAEAGYTFMEKHRVGGEVVYSNREWRDLVGTDHGHLGDADLITFGSNLLALAAKTDFKLTDEFDAAIDGWYFMKAAKNGGTYGTLGAAAGTDKAVGFEVDFRLGYNPEDNLRFEAGYAVFMPQGDFDNATSGNTSDMYLMGTMKF